MAQNNIQNTLKNLSVKWQQCPPPAQPSVIEQLVAEAGYDLPPAYLHLLSFSNGPEGALGIEPGWFQIWPAEHVIEYNQAYAVHENVPGFWGFGSSGGGELLAFDVQETSSQKVYMIPLIPMTLNEAILIAVDFATFVSAMGK